MKINCNVCIRNPSTTTALTLAVGIFLLTSASAAAATVSPLQQQVFAQHFNYPFLSILFFD
jgi:hypothetical protein